MLGTISASAATTVDPPVGSPHFLRLPFDDTAVRMIMGWYYDATSNATALACAHDGGDVAGYKPHCATDFRKVANKANVTFQVVAASDGRALRQDNVPGAGTMITIEHTTLSPAGEKYCTRYLHLDPTLPILPLGVWTPVAEGQALGWAGKTGTTKIHLHFDVKVGGCGGTAPRVDAFDIAGGLIPAGTPAVKEYYPSFSKFAGCGPNMLWKTCASRW